MNKTIISIIIIAVIAAAAYYFYSTRSSAMPAGETASVSETVPADTLSQDMQSDEAGVASLEASLKASAEAKNTEDINANQ